MAATGVPAVEPEHTVKEGFISKQGHLVRNWKKRFFRLTTRELRYYEKGSEEPRGVIRLDDVRSVRPTRGTGAFEVLTNSGKDFALIAENDTERKEWIDAIDQTRFKPSTQTKLLRETSTLYHLGRIDDRTKEALRDRIMEGDASSMERMAERLERLAAVGEDSPDRGSPELEDALAKLIAARTERQLIDSLAVIHRQLEKEPVTPAFRERLVSACMEHYETKDERWTTLTHQAYVLVIREIRWRPGSIPDGPAPEIDDGAAGGGGATIPEADEGEEDDEDDEDGGRGDGGDHDGEDGAVDGAEGRGRGRRKGATRTGREPASAASTTSIGSTSVVTGSVSSSSSSPSTTTSSSASSSSSSDSTLLSPARIASEATLATTRASVAAAAASAASAASAAAAAAAAAATATATAAAATAARAASAKASAVPRALRDSSRDTGPDASGASGGARGKISDPRAEAMAAAAEAGRVTTGVGLGSGTEGAFRLARVRTATPTMEDFRKLADKSKFSDLFELGNVLGRGGYSVVYKVTRKSTGEVLAAKFIAKSRVEGEPNVLRSLYREIALQRNVHHPHIVEFVSFHDEPDRWILVAELMSGGELFDRIVSSSSYDERQARDVVKALAEALFYLHSRRIPIAHRDLKPENILFASADPNAPLKLADLGFASEVPPEGLFTACGTPSYVAPEILNEQPHGTPVDCWSLGVIAFILLCGYAPFSNPNQAELFRRIRMCLYTFESPYWDCVSDHAKDLIRGLLTANPASRLTAEQVLKHPWITSTIGSAELHGVRHQMRAFNFQRHYPIKSGLLVKQGGFIRNWKERSFVLYNDSIEYYDPNESVKPRGVLPLVEIIEVRPLARRGSFHIVTTKGRDLTIQAPDETEARDWIRSITAQKAQRELMLRAQAAMDEDRLDEAIQLLRDAERYEKYVSRRYAGAGLGSGAGAAAGAATGTTAGAGGSGSGGGGGGGGGSGGALLSSPTPATAPSSISSPGPAVVVSPTAMRAVDAAHPALSSPTSASAVGASTSSPVSASPTTDRRPSPIGTGSPVVGGEAVAPSPRAIAATVLVPVATSSSVQFLTTDSSADSTSSRGTPSRTSEEDLASSRGSSPHGGPASGSFPSATAMAPHEE